MPFDYNSFLQGVQTGLRLGRTSPGRVPPIPPVPSGRYILAEDGTPIMDERFGTLISLGEAGSLPVTNINYSTYLYWVVNGQDVPSASAALTPGIYTVAETGITISLTRDGINYILTIGDLNPVVWSADYTDPEPCRLYFFHNLAYAGGREYALLLYKDGDEKTFQLPSYFDASTFNRLFFDAGNSGMRLITE